ncbi:UTP--glucose-1-phosphate uridylyltransferase GalU [Haliangium ochraceum]|uniref:UTP--glucose-1-phosphate uridylyltransferase n=1 Tax=Haliangium ochraceum (strain DSM 14365 / JCM 11303 / SMP-2) TaxID=502025 RepID=D0LZQ4_HALO1|nr:UTP--glucose-1-phosphate uridylyltransferase GalU [Haliangium ochraceum]ACY18033.1 UTP-glucose-1-phosphate uridylyltransferase [Haliangium ochraceum DSM 14365]
MSPSRPPIRKAVIPAAGLGTRFLPATKAIPKEMLPIVDKPTIQLVVEEAVAAGMEDIVIINGRQKVAIEDHFDHAFELEHTLRERSKDELLALSEQVSTMVRMVSVRQKRPLGLGHAVLCARPAVGEEPFAVLLGDDLIDCDEAPGIGQLAEVYARTGAGAVAVMEVQPGEEKLYGILDAEPMEDGLLRVRDMVEKPDPKDAPSRMAVIGRYVLPPEIWPILAEVKPGVGGEIQLTDALRELARGDGPGLIGVPIRGTRHDAGNKLGYLGANLAYALKRPELRDDVLALMRSLLDAEK